MATKGIGDGSDIDDLVFAVYKTSEETEEAAIANLDPNDIIYGINSDKTLFNNGRAYVSLELIKNQNYVVLFWAQNNDAWVKDNSFDLTNVTYPAHTEENPRVANHNKYEAFSGVSYLSNVTGSCSKTVTLTRPFAQINLATNNPTNYAVEIATSSVEIFGVQQHFNVASQTAYSVAGDAESVNYVAAKNPEEKFVITTSDNTVREYAHYVAMNYIFANKKGETQTVKVKCTINTAKHGEGIITEIDNVPVAQNYKTNIVGNLLTSSVDYTVILNNEWGTPDTNLYNVVVDGVSYDDFTEAVAMALQLGKPVEFLDDVKIDADNTITIPADKTLTFELNGHTLYGVTDDADKNDDGKIASADNEVMFDVRGTMNVNGGSVTIVHEGDTYKDFGWNACGEVFYLGFNGILNITNSTIENFGGVPMAYAIDLVNAAAPNGVTLKVENSTIKSSYIPVRVFNNGAGMNNVTIKNSTLEGTSRAFWVHVYSSKDNGGKGVKDATLNIDIYNPACNNKFIANDPDRIIEYGFDDEIRLDEFGGKAITDANGNVVEGVTEDLAGNYLVSSENGLQWIADQVNGNNSFAGKTIKLATDIDLDGVDFAPIGYNNGDKKYFEGTFDGNNNTIKNLKRTDLTYANKRAIGLFSQVKNATVKNLTLEDFVAATYGGEAAAIACEAVGDCTFENLTFNKGSVVSYNNDTAPVIGWANVGNFTLKDITVGSDVVIYSLWDSYDTSLGGLIGTLESPSTVHIENANISCVLNAFNDVCGNYQWYAYRRTGMVIGNMSETKDLDGRTVPDPEAAGVTCENVVVTYGDWMNYHYCEFEANGAPSYAKEGQWKFSRVEGQEWGRESNIDTDNCQHDTDESHNILLPVDQLFGGGQGVSGLREYAGVTVNYPASYRREVASAAALTEALGKGVSVILDADIDFGSTQLAITGENQVVDLGGHALTTANNWGGISLKNGATIKNGTITHAGNTAAIKAFNGSSVENVTINATCATADKTVTGIAVQQGATIESIKNVTINGVSQGIEVGYQATVGLIENAVVNESNNGTAKGIGLVINGGMVGKAKDCTFKGETYGITLHLKGVYAAGLELENCTVEGTTASIYAWDEKGISNTSGSLVLTYDAATTLTGPFVWDFEDECQSVVTLNLPQ